MVTIAGNGMGPNDFGNINLDIPSFDMVICDKSFEVDGDNIYKLGFRDIKETISKNRDKNILYVVTGSCIFYSAAPIVAKYLKEQNIEYRIVDNISSKSYMLSRLAISEADVDTLSIHGRSSIDLSSLLNKKYTFVLCDDDSITKIKETLKYLDSDDYAITIGSRLGYSDESIEILQDKEYLSPYVLLIEKRFSDIGMEDSDFVTENGMITKKLKRELSINELELKPNMSLWDIGAGSGSIAISAYKKHKVDTKLFEKNETRYKNILQNISSHKVVATDVYLGDASIEITKIEDSVDRVFIGGGGSGVIDKLDYIYDKLSQDGIIVANFVTLIHLNRAIDKLNSMNVKYNVHSISIDGYKSDLLISESQRLMFMIKVVK
jgi:precorrin-6Y C5,15-methyltransferase (decarboxylating)